MPIVGEKHFAYNKAGRKAAAKAKRRLGKRNYSPEAIEMAKKIYR